MATERQEYGRQAALSGAGSGALSGAGLGLSLAKGGAAAFTVGAGAAAAPALLPILGLTAGIAGIAGLTKYMQSTKQYDAQKKLEREQKKLAEQMKREQARQSREMSAKVTKSRRRGETFDYEPGDDIMIEAAGAGSTYDNFMKNTYGG
jgi:hypothetical protein